MFTFYSGLGRVTGPACAGSGAAARGAAVKPCSPASAQTLHHTERLTSPSKCSASGFPIGKHSDQGGWQQPSCFRQTDVLSLDGRTGQPELGGVGHGGRCLLGSPWGRQGPRVLGGGGGWAPHRTRTRQWAPHPQAAGTAVGPWASPRHCGQHSMGTPLGWGLRESSALP